MGYEARQDAMNDYIADQIAEATPDESEYTMDEDIPNSIKDGLFDVAVWKRIKVLYGGWCSDGRKKFHEHLVEGMG